MLLGFIFDHIWSGSTVFLQEKYENYNHINYVILMQAVHTIHPSYYYYASPVKSDPETETDEYEPTVLRPAENLDLSTDIGRSKLKSSLCKNFAMNGFCPYGKKCQFAHGPQELRCNENINTSYKTKPCFSFLKKGYCPYGHRCNFQHREEEKPIKCLNTSIISNFPEVMLSFGGA